MKKWTEPEGVPVKSFYGGLRPLPPPPSTSGQMHTPQTAGARADGRPTIRPNYSLQTARQGLHKSIFLPSRSLRRCCHCGDGATFVITRNRAIQRLPAIGLPRPAASCHGASASRLKAASRNEGVGSRPRGDGVLKTLLRPQYVSGYGHFNL